MTSSPVGADALHRRSVAFEEAGHAAAARAFGWVVLGVTLSEVKFLPTGRRDLGGTIEAMIVVISGMEAVWSAAETVDARLQGRILPRPWIDDDDMISRFLTAGEGDPDNDPELVARYAASVTRSDEARTKLIAFAYVQARDLVRERFDAIKALADFLVEHGEAERDDVVRLLGEFDNTTNGGTHE